MNIPREEWAVIDKDGIATTHPNQVIAGQFAAAYAYLRRENGPYIVTKVEPTVCKTITLSDKTAVSIGHVLPDGRSCVCDRPGEHITLLQKLEERNARLDNRFVPNYPGSWPEDLAHENGDYECLCTYCGDRFYGHKRRVVCKLCVNSMQAQQFDSTKPPPGVSPDTAGQATPPQPRGDMVLVENIAVALHRAFNNMLDCSPKWPHGWPGWQGVTSEEQAFFRQHAEAALAAAPGQGSGERECCRKSRENYGEPCHTPLLASQSSKCEEHHWIEWGMGIRKCQRCGTTEGPGTASQSVPSDGSGELPPEAIEDAKDWAFIERCLKECDAGYDEGEDGVFWTFSLAAMKKLRRLATAGQGVEDTKRLDYLIEHSMTVRRLNDTGLYMVLANEYPATGSEFETAREAIDECRFAAPTPEQQR